MTLVKVYLLIPLGIVLFVLPRVSPACPAVSGFLWGGPLRHHPLWRL